MGHGLEAGSYTLPPGSAQLVAQFFSCREARRLFQASAEDLTLHTLHTPVPIGFFP